MNRAHDGAPRRRPRRHADGTLFPDHGAASLMMFEPLARSEARPGACQASRPIPLHPGVHSDCTLYSPGLSERKTLEKVLCTIRAAQTRRLLHGVWRARRAAPLARARLVSNKLLAAATQRPMSAPAPPATREKRGPCSMFAVQCLVRARAAHRVFAPQRRLVTIGGTPAARRAPPDGRLR